jgi:hypothetical protein
MSPITITPADISIPSSTQTVTVKIIEAMARIAVPSAIFYEAAPGLGGTTKPTLAAPGLAFLLEHPASGRRVVFDLGMRKDFENLAPVFNKALRALTGEIDAVVEDDVATQLQKGGVDLNAIEAVIWRLAHSYLQILSLCGTDVVPKSHSHPDHTGDMSTFPPSVALVVGAGTQAHFRPAYPTKEDSSVLETDFE